MNSTSSVALHVCGLGSKGSYELVTTYILASDVSLLLGFNQDVLVLTKFRDFKGTYQSHLLDILIKWERWTEAFSILEDNQSLICDQNITVSYIF